MMVHTVMLVTQNIKDDQWALTGKDVEGSLHGVIFKY
jgi:hypothetical protein